MKLLVVTIAVFAGGLASCVKIKSGCQGMSISPSSWSSRIGKSRVFTATTEGVVDPSVTWSISSSAGQLTQSGLDSNQVRLVLGSSSGSYQLRATSNADSSRRCICGISVSDFSFSFTRPVSIPGSDATIVVGDVAIGAPAALPLTEGPGGGRAYVAVVRDTDGDGTIDDRRVQQFTLDSFFSSSATPRYDTQLVPSPDSTPLFDFIIPPAIAADGNGNGYWLERESVSSFARALRFLGADALQTDPPQSIFFQDLFVSLDGGSGFAVDSTGNVYVVGLYFGSGTARKAEPELIRIRDIATGDPVAEVVTVVNFSFGYDLAVDAESRVYVLGLDSKSSTTSISRYLPGGAFDRDFMPLSDVTAGAYDIGVDADNALYVLAYVGGGSKLGPSSTQIRVVDELGGLRDTLTSAGGGSTFQNVTGFGVAPDGTLVVFDDIQSATQAAEVVVVEP